MRPLIVAVLVTAFGCLALPVSAQMTQFTACAKRSDGSLYNVRSARTDIPATTNIGDSTNLNLATKPCKPGDTRITWNSFERSTLDSLKAGITQMKSLRRIEYALGWVEPQLKYLRQIYDHRNAPPVGNDRSEFMRVAGQVLGELGVSRVRLGVFEPAIPALHDELVALDTKFSSVTFMLQELESIVDDPGGVKYEEFFHYLEELYGLVISARDKAIVTLM